MRAADGGQAVCERWCWHIMRAGDGVGEESKEAINGLHGTEGDRAAEVCCSIVAGERLRKRFRGVGVVSEVVSGAGWRMNGRD